MNNKKFKYKAIEEQLLLFPYDSAVDTKIPKKSSISILKERNKTTQKRHFNEINLINIDVVRDSYHV